MKISVVIPAYNRATLLPATLKSILAQTLAAAEIIVVDDGSTDETATMAAHFAPAVQCVTIPNSGDLVARNTGLRMASGDLVSFCDSDDVWQPDLLSSMAALWQAEPRVRTAYSDFVLVRDSVWEQESKFAAAPEGFWDGLRVIEPGMGVFEAPLVERLIAYQPFFPSCMTVNRAFFLDLGGWDETTSRIVGCDFATALRVAEHPPIGIVSRPLVGIRKHASNFSGDVQAMNLGDAKVLELMLATRPSLAPHADLIRQSIAVRRRNALDAAFARHDFDAVSQVFPLLPPELKSTSTRVKHGISGLPAPARSILTNILTRAGTRKGRMSDLAT